MRPPRPHRAALLALALLLAARLLVPAPSAFGQTTDEFGQTSGNAPAALTEPLNPVTLTVDLVFTPVTPCRIIDTRLAGGPIAGGTTRNFAVAGATGFAAQGGNAAGCGIPAGAPAAVINYVAVNPAGPGDLRVTPVGTPVPLASVINYAAVGGLNIANGVATPLSTGAAPHITVQADVSATDLVADVLGYYKDVACQTGTVKRLGQCFETALRAAAGFQLASDTCRAAGGRLAGGMELHSLRGGFPLTLAGDDGEWTDAFAFSDNCVFFFGVTVTNAGVFQKFLAGVASSFPFRCVFRPLP